MGIVDMSVLASIEATAAHALAVVVLLTIVPATFRAKMHEGCSPAVVLLGALCLTNAGFAMGFTHRLVGQDWGNVLAQTLFMLGGLMTIRASLSWLGSTTWLAVGAIAMLAIGAATWPLYWG